MSEHSTHTGTHRATAPPRNDGTTETSGASLGELFSELSRNVSALVSQEVELAKAELRATARTAGKGAGMYAGAGVAGHFVLLFLSLAAVAGLANWIGLGYAALVIAALWAIIAAVLFVAGRKQFRDVEGLQQTGETIKEIPRTFNSKEDTP
ncbi:phage holin family protein [Paeniglutamicibacter sp. ABSL32-1]|uniref:phage holin family protein n=1 Tax=Paeniglutamicibacter quisquiliarum TaxID=2849498 RepID=UPI001C2D0ABA|nr:phage holin family protein [Paeniglutamicibacter quisquiliarum]MBV1780812.1 phage holin family protein [Paeniglutamicibacter quisquiliarum]